MSALASAPAKPVAPLAAIVSSALPRVVSLVVVLTDRAASDFFVQKLQQWAKSNNYPGLAASELPKGIKETQRISIQRVR